MLSQCSLSRFIFTYFEVFFLRVYTNHKYRGLFSKSPLDRSAEGGGSLVGGGWGRYVPTSATRDSHCGWGRTSPTSEWRVGNRPRPRSDLVLKGGPHREARRLTQTNHTHKGEPGHPKEKRQIWESLTPQAQAHRACWGWPWAKTRELRFPPGSSLASTAAWAASGSSRGS